MRKIIPIIALFVATTSLNAQNKKFEEVSIDEFMTETQYGSDTSDTIDLIWWIPTEYWNVVFSQKWGCI